MTAYGIIIVCGILIAMIIAYFLIKRRGFNPDVVFDLVLVGLPLAIVGARVYFLIFETIRTGELFGFWDWFKVWEGGLAIYGGVIGALLGALILRFLVFRKRKPYEKLSLPQMLDLAFAVFLIAQAIGRWGNFANQEVYGAKLASDSYFAILAQGGGFWGMFFSYNKTGAAHQPLFFYESMLNLVGFLVLVKLYDSKRRSFDGFIFSLYCIWYGLVRAILEGLRDPEFILGKNAFPASTVVSILFILFGVTFILVHILRARQAGKKPMLFVPEEKLSSDYFDYKTTSFYLKKKWDYDPYKKKDKFAKAKDEKAQDADSVDQDEIPEPPPVKRERKIIRSEDEFDD